MPRKTNFDKPKKDFGRVVNWTEAFLDRAGLNACMDKDALWGSLAYLLGEGIERLNKNAVFEAQARRWNRRICK
jgi:hypothetical protein